MWLWLGDNGRLLSEHTVPLSGILGVTPDGKFVASNGSELSLIDTNGEVELMSILGPLVMFRGGVVVANGVLYSYARRKGGGGIQLMNWSGRTVWNFQTNAPIGRSAVDPDDNVYFYGPNWVVHSLDGEGNVRWTYPYPSSNIAFQVGVPVVSPDGRVALCATSRGGLVVLDRGGNELWHDAVQATQTYNGSAVFVANGDLLVSDGWHLRRYDSGGELIWMLDLPNIPNKSSGINRPPIVANDGTIYCLGWDHVFAISPDGGLKWNHALSKSAARKDWRQWGKEWGMTTSSGDLAVLAGDFEGLQRVPASRPGVSRIDLVRNERLLCLGADGGLKWEQYLPTSTSWSVPRSRLDFEALWKSRMGQRYSKHLQLISIDTDGTIFVSGFADHKTKIWAIDGN